MTEQAGLGLHWSGHSGKLLITLALIGLDTEQMTEQVAYNLDLDCIGLDCIGLNKGSTGTFTNTIHKGMTILH